MPTASTVTIRLDGDSAKLVKELNKAQRKTKSFGTSAKKAIGGAAKVFATLGIGAALALGTLVKKMLQVSDALGKTADKIGLTTEQLAGLQLQAEITGTTSLVLEKAFKNMSKVIVDVSRGAGVAKISFDEMGISADELLEKTAFEQFTTIAEKMKFLGTRTEQLAFAYEVFGGRATDLLLLLDGGKESFDAYIQRAKDLGLAMSRFDIAQLEAANDAMLEMASATKGLGNRIARAVAPLITVFSERFVQFVIDFTKAAKDGENGLDSLKTSSATVLAGIINGINLVQVAWLGVKLAIDTTVLALKELKGVDVMGPMAKEIELVEEQIRRVLTGLVFDPMGGLVENQGERLAAIDQLQTELRVLKKHSQDLIDQGFVGEDPLAELRTRIATTMAKIQSLSVHTAESIGHAVAEAYAEGLVSAPPAPAMGMTDPSLVKGLAQTNIEAAASTVAAWQLANAQRLEADAALKLSLEESELVAAARLTELAISHAKERVALELEAKAVALDEAGVPVSEEDRLAAETQVQEEAIKGLKKHLDARVKLITENAKAVTKVEKTAQENRKAAFAATESFIATIQSSGISKSKVLNTAFFLFEKALAAKRAFVATQVAVTQTLASGLPYPANIVAAATVAAIGYASVAAIAASAFSAPSFGGASGVGTDIDSGGTGIFGDDTTQDSSGAQDVLEQRPVQIIFQGPVLADDDSTRQFVTDIIREAVDDRDVLVFGGTSRQAEVIRTGVV
jgi:hypothetical protein